MADGPTLRPKSAEWWTSRPVQFWNLELVTYVTVMWDTQLYLTARELLNFV